MGYTFLPCDVQWNFRNLMLWPLTSVGVGLLAGFVGIAGGILQGPLLLEMGVLPQVRNSRLLQIANSIPTVGICTGSGSDDVFHDPLHFVLHLSPVLCI